MTALASRPAKKTSAPAERRAGRGFWHVLGHAAVALLSAAAVVGVYLACVRTPLGQTVDTMMMRGADVNHPRVVEVLDRTLNGTTLASLVLVCVAAAAIGFIRRRVDLALAAGLLVIGANASTRLFKSRLPRPDLDGTGMPNSFPSGHTTAAASVAFALILVLPFAIRGTVALIGAAYVTIIAIATVWAEWHRPSDTVAALFVVLAWGAGASALVRARRARIPGVTARPNRLAMLLFGGVGALSALAALLGIGAVVLSERAVPDLVSGRFAFAAGVAAITAVVAAVFAIWVRLAAGDQPVGDAVTTKAAAHPAPAAD
ncbi:phosphatase PAP2 family protein [Actinoplanes friuliensis]|jgi:membrane-associated phospholipid phosphatase|uniref:Phosphoesterase, PA-phosphatase-like protein n=1 Tax=Actinoplanes friuliensis DSM 7358 TaxID=1246995 RepID=U5W3H1_9ACTN|nr:phosphatase PAP2 family protein [Actinoplanes friuliensis]AGZ43669.1 phosphoesterase, PA-phosphatase-like protein [Actinoplanes friuliensis DSM 7358]